MRRLVRPLRLPEPPPRPTPGPWRAVVEAVDGMLPFGRWRIYLTNGWMRYGAGETGWGWLRFTLRGAQRKAARELARKVRSEARLAERNARAAAWARSLVAEQADIRRRVLPPTGPTPPGGASQPRDRRYRKAGR